MNEKLLFPTLENVPLVRVLAIRPVDTGTGNAKNDSDVH